MHTEQVYRNLNIADSRKNAGNKKEGGFLRALLFYIIPFIVINAIVFWLATAQPDFDISVVDAKDYSAAQVTIKIKSVFPVKEFDVTHNDDALKLKKLDDKTYSAVVYQNGTLGVYTMIFNGMSKTEYLNISSIDDAPPIITEKENEEGYVSIYVEDSQSGVNYDLIYAVLENDTKIKPSLIDKGTQLVRFNYESPSIEIHIPDRVGHESIATFTTIEVTE